MSNTETHYGKLRKLEITTSLEDLCEQKCKNNGEGISKIPEYYKSWEEVVRYDLSEKYIIIDGELWEIFDHIAGDEGDVDIMIPNKDGTFTFFQQFYNGGTCLSECLEDGIKRLKLKS